MLRDSPPSLKVPFFFRLSKTTVKPGFGDKGDQAKRSAKKSTTKAGKKK
jgi:hypothetical protein